MRLDASHKKWAAATTLLAAIASIAYFAYAAAAPHGPSGGSWQGLLYGVAGSTLMIFAGLISARKKVPTWRMGRASTWLRGHIWLGMLSLLLIAFHAGFRWGGELEVALWIVLLLIVASGLFGLVVQSAVTTDMTARVSHETIYEQIGQVCAENGRAADTLVERFCGPLSSEESGGDAAGARRAKPPAPRAGSEPLKAFYLERVRPFLTQKYRRSHYLADDSRAAHLFAQIRNTLPSELHEPIEQLAEYCEERRQLALQARLHLWLHGWLFVHVPLSWALLVLGCAHAIVTLYY